MPRDITQGENTEIAQRVYAERTRTYRGFLQMAKWFLIHAALVLVGLYIFGIWGMAVLGFLVVIAGVAALLYGPYAASRAARAQATSSRQPTPQPYRNAAE